MGSIASTMQCQFLTTRRVHKRQREDSKFSQKHRKMKVATFGIPKRNKEKVIETTKPYFISLEMEAFIPLANGDHRDSKSIKQFLLDLVFPCYCTPGKSENL